MNFGEKLFKLRKEKGLSQEALAELLGTTRQAVSKWENDQGFPETEKLLQLANIFEVSTDFLLKGGAAAEGCSGKGYYVSRELAKGYLAGEKRVCRYLGLAFLFWALAGVPFVMLPARSAPQLLGVAACAVLGVGAAVAAIFAEQQDHKVLKAEPLLFDHEFFKELSAEYRSLKKKYTLVAVPCTFLWIVGLLAILFTAKGYLEWTGFHALAFLGFAAGLYGFTQSVGAMDAYELLVNNQQYCSRSFFKLRRKIRAWLDRF